jgi:uncharacterized metal-binding protein
LEQIDNVTERNAMNENQNTPVKKSPVVYACSGCSDAGEIADRVARQLTRDGAAKMSCLAGIGGRVKSLVATAEKAERILVVDGCPLNCARRTLELAGFKKFDHLELHTLGIRKGSTPVTDERIADGVLAAKKILAGDTGSEQNLENIAELALNNPTKELTQS